MKRHVTRMVKTVLSMIIINIYVALFFEVIQIVVSYTYDMYKCITDY